MNSQGRVPRVTVAGPPDAIASPPANTQTSTRHSNALAGEMPSDPWVIQAAP